MLVERLQSSAALTLSLESDSHSSEQFFVENLLRIFSRALFIALSETLSTRMIEFKTKVYQGHIWVVYSVSYGLI